MQNPGTKLWDAAKEILRYLVGAKEDGILFDKSGNKTLRGFVDSNWAGSEDSRRSTSGVILQLANAPITVKCKLQTCVALSSTEAEYIAACLAAQEAIWMRRLLHDLGFLDTIAPTPLYEDNESCIKIAENNRVDARTKHIDVKYHFIREAISNQEIRLSSINTAEQPADLLTKTHGRNRFQQLKVMLGIGTLTPARSEGVCRIILLPCCSTEHSRKYVLPLSINFASHINRQHQRRYILQFVML
jgi:hypothetical protein